MTTPFCYYAHNKKSIAKIQKKLAFFLIEWYYISR